MNLDWIEKQEEQINESTYSDNKVVSKRSAKKENMTFTAFNEQLNALVTGENPKKMHKGMDSIQTGFVLRSDGGREYIGMGIKLESVKILWLFSFSKKNYLTRKIRFYTDDNAEDIRISLHEKWKLTPDAESFRKRKFRFYIKHESLNPEFAKDCYEYLLFNKSNHELIKSIPHYQREDDGILMS